ncbi:hypothetical protein DRO03_11675 [Methanosarcinales archaeon]|nr:MAG: hypothetical protein DRO03_11675 [Methanosarcinales archaeon]
MSLYLKVALLAKESSQLPLLLHTYSNLEGLCFFDKKEIELLCHGDVNKYNLHEGVHHISNKQIQVVMPFEVNSEKYGTILLAFSSKDFEKEKLQILINGAMFFIIFMTIGFFGTLFIGRSITKPIERLAHHIKLNELENIPLLDSGDEIGDFSRTINDLALTLKEREAELEYKAYFDALTKLPNRSLFMEQFNQIIDISHRESKDLVLLFIDLNDFKFINDTYGHDIGDSLLVEFTQRIKKSVRKSDIFARISGDEFNLVLYNFGGYESISQYCKSLFDLLKEPFQILDKSIYVSMSIGVANYPTDGDSAEVLINKADRAMYHAKEIGGNQYKFYNKDFHTHNKDRLTLEIDLRNAIFNNKIELNYQPKVSLSSEKLCGMEALARWKHPELGYISPEKFISLAEEIGLIGELGRMVMYKACKQMKSWLDEGLDDMTIAINLSPQQFSDPNLLVMIEDILKETGLSAANMELEITESAIMHQSEYVKSMIDIIDKMGISIALDDFGTGYSSLSRLHQFPFSTLKVDRSFIQRLGKNEEANSFVRAIISMAKALNMKTVIEGVETKEQLEILSEMEIQNLEIQGYYFSRPLNKDKFSKFAGLKSI